MAEKRYSNDEITVVWKPDLCIHSTNCWKSLLPVFDPRRRPWVDMSAASTERIIQTVGKCPSGALSFMANDTEEDEARFEEVTGVRAEVQPNGPLLVYGTLTINDRDGNETVRSKTTAFCRCGQSKNKPYCDGSHIDAQFSDDPV
jgi:uncharacterized Fe-S cluster protein YjdI